MAWFRKAPPVAVQRTGLSIHDPIYLGQDPLGQPVRLQLAFRNCLVGEPGGGKSSGLCNVLGHAALCPDVEPYQFDGKDLEMPLWAPLATQSIGRDIRAALDVLGALATQMEAANDQIKAAGLRKLPLSWLGTGSIQMRLIVVDELAMYTSVLGSQAEQKEFARLLRMLVGIGRASGYMVLAATQRPSSDIVPTALRDLFAYRWAMRCPNKDSSDIILGNGRAGDGYDAAEIDPAAQGVGYLLAEGGIPRLFRAAYLDTTDIRHLVAAGLALRAGEVAA